MGQYGQNGREYFTAKLTYAAATKSFSGNLAFVGKCQGSSTVKARRAWAAI